MSIVGLLRHMAVCCPAANSLVQCLGGGINAFKRQSLINTTVLQPMKLEAKTRVISAPTPGGPLATRVQRCKNFQRVDSKLAN